MRFNSIEKKSALGDFQSSKVVFIRNKHFNIDESGFCFHKLIPLPTMNCFCPLAKCNIYHLNSVCRFRLLLFFFSFSLFFTKSLLSLFELMICTTLIDNAFHFKVRTKQLDRRNWIVLTAYRVVKRTEICPYDRNFFEQN